MIISIMHKFLGDRVTYGVRQADISDEFHTLEDLLKLPYIVYVMYLVTNSYKYYLAANYITHTIHILIPLLPVF